MAEEKNELEGKKLEDEQTEEAAGGFAGSDKYTQQEYSKAGVSWQHSVFKKDSYYVLGVKITQDQAELITEKALRLGRPLTRDELIILGINV